MKRVERFILVLCSALILAAGCKPRDDNLTPSSPVPDVSAGGENAARASAVKLNLADGIIQPDGAEAGTFSSTAYALRYFGEITPGDKAIDQLDDQSDPVFEKSKPKLIQMLGQGLQGCEVNKVEEIPASAIPPSGASGILFDVLTDTVGGTSHLVFVCTSGDVYLSSRGQWDTALHYQLKNSKSYDDLKALMQSIQEESRKLEYQVEMSLQLDRFSPQSEAVRIVLTNESDQAVVCPDGFSLEPWDSAKQEAGTPLVSKNGEERRSVAIPPPDDGAWGYAWAYLDLTAFEGGQQPGEYRVKTTAQRGDERCELTAIYHIDPSSQEISYPPPPEMSPENQDYCDRMMRVWGGLGDVMHEEFSESNMSAVLENNLYLVFHNLDFLEGGAYADAEEVPAAVVEDLMTRRFPIRAEEVRKMLRSGSDGADGDYYDPERKIYVMHSGYGGGPGSEPVVVDSQKEGELLTLVCDWYSGLDDSFSHQTRVTIRIKEDGDFMYIKNEILSDG